MRFKRKEGICFFFRRCHRWVSGASVVYLLSLSAGVFIISFGLLRESSSLFFVGFIVVVKEIYTSVKKGRFKEPIKVLIAPAGQNPEEAP